MKKSSRTKWAMRALTIYTIYKLIPAPFWEGLMQGVIQNSQDAVPGAVLSLIWLAILGTAAFRFVKRIKRHARETRLRYEAGIRKRFGDFAAQAQEAPNLRQGWQPYGQRPHDGRRW